MTQPKTTLVKPLWPDVAPRAVPPKAKKSPERTVRSVEVAVGHDLEICNDPPLSTTMGPRSSKYLDIFEKLPVGGCLKCSAGKAGTVAQALRKWIRESGKDDLVVRSVGDYGDGKGRVWLLKKGGAK